MIHVIELFMQFVVGDLDSLQVEALGQMRRNKANDLQVLQIIQSRSGRTEGQERKQQCAHGKPRRCSFDSIATHHSFSVTEPIRLSRL